ncbi:hypothetical protein D3C86_1921010 [compost metagenome]
MQFLQPQRLMLAQQFDDRQRTLDRTHAAGFCLGLHRFDLPQPEWTLACSFFKVQQDARRPQRLRRFADNRAADA